MLRKSNRQEKSVVRRRAVFRKLGMNGEAKQEGRIFAELKDDPGVLPLANMFLRKHPEMRNESVFWHIHDLAPVGQ